MTYISRRIRSLVLGAALTGIMIFGFMSSEKAHAFFYHGASFNYCHAQAFCPQSGRIASCYVYANPYFGQSCNFRWQVGVGVQCTGWDAWGNWVAFQDLCP